jgi:hypothetical protein
MDHIEWESADVRVTPQHPSKNWPARFALDTDLGMNLGPDELFQCLRGHAQSLPQTLRFVIRTDSTGTVTHAEVTGTAEPVRQCFGASLSGGSILGGRQSFEESMAPATIRGNIKVWLRHSE